MFQIFLEDITNHTKLNTLEFYDFQPSFSDLVFEISSFSSASPKKGVQIFLQSVLAVIIKLNL